MRKQDDDSRYDAFRHAMHVMASAEEANGDALGIKPPPLLYHYTSAQGLLGMIDSTSIYMSDASCLNDQSEIAYARNLVWRVLARRADSTSTAASEAFSELLQGVTKEFSESPATDLVAAHRFYVACFCEGGDLLSQWRAYGSPGSGYVVAFKTAQLMESARAFGRDKSAFLVRVIYAPDVQEHVSEVLIDAWAKTLPADILAGSAPLEKYQEAAGALIFALCRVLPHFKHPVFSEEKEWRLLGLRFGRSTSHQLKFRQAGSAIVPYLVLNLESKSGEDKGKLPLATVAHAPAPEPELRKRTLRELLQAKGYSLERVCVAGSDVPLRVV